MYKRFFFLIIFFLLFLGCSDSERLRDYLMNIPEKEEINASLYHYEIIVGEARKEFFNQNYYRVFDLYERYLSVFFESTIPHEEELLYWVGRSVKELLRKSSNLNDKEVKKFFAYIKADKQRKNNLGIEFEGKYSSNQHGETFPKKLFYQGKHFTLILDQRGDYQWEKQALREVYDQKFISLEKSFLKKDSLGNDYGLLKKNLEYGYWLITRYPDLFSPKKYHSLLKKYIDFEKISQLSKSYRKKWNRIQEILRVNQWVMMREGDFPSVCFPNSWPVVVYNRTHWISSRNLTSLALWEPFQVKSQVLGEDGQIWYAIVFGKNRRGYVDEEDFKESCNQEGKDRSSMIEKYQIGYQQYLAQDYLEAEETLSIFLYDLENLPDPDMYVLVRGWTLFYLVLKEISLRSTSLDNPFTHFAKEHNEYFVVSRDLINLEVSDYFLKKIITYNSGSPMLQYFDKFN